MYMIQSFKDMLEQVYHHNGIPTPGSPEEQSLITAVICGILQGIGADMETMFNDDGYVTGFICEGVTYYIGVNTLELMA